MIFPISDDDSHILRPAWVTISILLANVALYLLQLSIPAFSDGWSVVPMEIIKSMDLIGLYQFDTPHGAAVIQHANGPAPIHLTLLSSMFMHGGWMHLGGNMLYLWIFGDNIEHRFGGKVFLLFYLFTGIVGSLTHIYLAPDSIIPLVGASGAISGILGAYIVMFPWNKVNVIIFYRFITIPAILAIGLWAGMQFFMGYNSLANMGQSGGTAYAAHIGGFVAGALLGLIGRMIYRTEPDSVFQSFQDRDPASKRIW